MNSYTPDHEENTKGFDINIILDPLRDEIPGEFQKLTWFQRFKNLIGGFTVAICYLIVFYAINKCQVQKSYHELDQVEEGSEDKPKVIKNEVN